MKDKIIRKTELQVNEGKIVHKTVNWLLKKK